MISINYTGIYIHIPFCNSICSYCDFYSGATNNQSLKDSYTKAVLFAMENQPFGRLKVDTIYLGGGTPTVLGAENLSAIIEKAASCFSLSADTEITLEANPESTTKPLLASLKSAGYTRISFGVQSSIDKELRVLGRAHSPLEARQAILEAERQGFKHISADLMLNIPYQTMASLEKSISFLTALPLDHISAYMLIVEPETPLASSPHMDFCPDPDTQSDIYLKTIELLGEFGFNQYEISNFAKKGGKSLHNLKYWQSKPYLGIGPSAHSYVNGERFAFSSSTDDFVASKNVWQDTISAGKGGDWEEYAMLRLRLNPGLSLSVLEKEFGTDTTHIRQRLEPMIKQGYATLKNNYITFTPKGFLISNYLTGELLY